MCLSHLCCPLVSQFFSMDGTERWIDRQRMGRHQTNTCTLLLDAANVTVSAIVRVVTVVTESLVCACSEALLTRYWVFVTTEWLVCVCCMVTLSTVFLLSILSKIFVFVASRSVRYFSWLYSLGLHCHHFHVTVSNSDILLLSQLFMALNNPVMCRCSIKKSLVHCCMCLFVSTA